MTDSFTEWGVRWGDAGRITVEDRDDEMDARDFLRFLAEDCGATDIEIVCRTVTRTEWRKVGSGPTESECVDFHRFFRCTNPGCRCPANGEVAGDGG